MDAWAAELRDLFADPGEDLPALLGRFFRVAGVPLPVPDPLPEPLARGARALIGARSPTEAELPLATIADSGIRCLVISGGHHAGYETVCNVIAEKTNSERTIITGAGHLVPDAGDQFNSCLETFLLKSG